MVKIRLTRAGSKKRPFYRVTAIDERKRRDGRPLEFLGTYDPRPSQEELKLDIEGIEAWIAKGAQMTDTVRTLVKRARGRAIAAAAAPAPTPTPAEAS
ncbi:MAG: 30S ribosomal protein S16 [Myxococcota bacterium]|nr:30S ribosomal protein S16 [Myxococcota bacterium]